jgi:hypothetical protein
MDVYQHVTVVPLPVEESKTTFIVFTVISYIA